MAEYGCEGKESTKVSDFLCHRAGNFGFQGGMPDLALSDWEGWTNALAKQAPFREPGSSQGYHALTYGWLVGEILRRVDGRSVGEYFQQEIATPFSLDFKIGLDDEDLLRCSDILPDPRSESLILKNPTLCSRFYSSRSVKDCERNPKRRRLSSCF